MNNSIDKVENVNENNQNNILNEELSPGYALGFQILLIIHSIILFFMLVFFGFHHLVLFTVSITLTIRMILGIKNKRPNYFIKSLFLYIVCFICYIIKIVFRFLLTYFTFKIRNDINNLKDMNIIETENILWIKGFDIKINGIWSIVVLSICIIFWLILIILFVKKKKCFNYVDNFEKEQYINLINKYYEQHQSDEQIQPAENNNNNNINNNNFNLNNNGRI